MPSFVRNDENRQDVFAFGRVPHNLRSGTLDKLNEVMDAFAAEMKNRVKDPPTLPIIIDLDDPIVERSHSGAAKADPPAYVSAYYQEVEVKVMKLLEHNPVIQDLQAGEAVSDFDLIRLERVLEAELGGELSRLQQAGSKVTSWLALVRDTLHLPDMPDYGTVVRARFHTFVTRHPFNAEQTLFMNRLAEVMATRRTFEPGQLYEAPFTHEFGHNALERHFSDREIDEMVALINNLTANTGN